MYNTYNLPLVTITFHSKNNVAIRNPLIHTVGSSSNNHIKTNYSFYDRNSGLQL